MSWFMPAMLLSASKTMPETNAPSPITATACRSFSPFKSSADFRPATQVGKIAREGTESLSLELERTRDVLGEAVASKPRAILVAFAAEVGEAWLDRARDKARRKGAQLLVGNRVDGAGSAFDALDSEAVVLGRDGSETMLPRAPKSVQAGRILDLLAKELPAAGTRHS